METAGKSVKGLKVFLDEVMSEMRKTTWPTRQELTGSTMVVIVSVLMVGFLIAIYDKILVELLKLIIPSG